jgi:hypothetical protein
VFFVLTPVRESALIALDKIRLMNESTKLFEWITRIFRARLSPEKFALLKQRVSEPLAMFNPGNLPCLARIYGSDKWGIHWYCQHYQRHFAPLRKKRITILEIGIGGFSDPTAGGGSLRMWRKYFPRGLVCGIDIVDKTPHNEKRIRTFQGDQTDETFLRKVIQKIGVPDIIIDDGSHINEHMIKTFEILFPLLAADGIYALEDTQTSYWPSFGGSSENFHDAPTTMCMLKRLIDGLNHAEYIKSGFKPSYYDQHITAMHFYHNLVFVQKGLNNEGSNLIKNNMASEIAC